MARGGVGGAGEIHRRQRKNHCGGNDGRHREGMMEKEGGGEEAGGRGHGMEEWFDLWKIPRGSQGRSV
jgi:hypothetical protein